MQAKTQESQQQQSLPIAADSVAAALSAVKSESTAPTLTAGQLFAISVRDDAGETIPEAYDLLRSARDRIDAKIHQRRTDVANNRRTSVTRMPCLLTNKEGKTKSVLMDGIPLSHETFVNKIANWVVLTNDEEHSKLQDELLEEAIANPEGFDRALVYRTNSKFNPETKQTTRTQYVMLYLERRRDSVSNTQL